METFLADLVPVQRAAGLQVEVLVHGDPQPDDPAWLHRVPVQWHLAYAPIAAGFRRALADRIAAFEPDVLHLHLPNNAALWALTLPAARARPWLVHWHADVVFHQPGPTLRLAHAVYRVFERALLRQAERILATSPDYLAASQTLAPWRDKCAVAPLGIALSPAESSAGEAGPAWEAGRLRLLTLGRLAHYKDHATLMRAAATVPGVELLVAGDGELRDTLTALAAQLQAGPGRVRMLGGVSEARKLALLRECDLFCLASNERTEAFGMVLLEAMQQGRPCLVAELAGSGMPWVVRETGAGWTAPVGDVAAWARAIAAAQEAPAERAARGEAGRAAFAARFSIASSARALASHYRSLVAQPPVQPAGDVLFVIPARDEVATIATIVGGLRAAGWHNVLVVDDHSADGTADAARAAGARVLRAELPMGAWGAMQTGMRHARAQGFQAVLTMDADGQHLIGEIPYLLAARDRSDVVIGAFPERASRARLLAWRWFRQLAGFDLRDLTSGFRLYSGRAISLLAAEEATLLDYQDIGILLLLRRAGLRIEEVPVLMEERSSGKSRVFSSWLQVGRYMVLTTLLCLARWDVRRDGRRPRAAS
jgi:glycosyltransferase involved in cell wall biosynthesis